MIRNICGPLLSVELIFKNRVGHEEPVNTEIRTSIQEIYQEWQERKEGYPLMIKANVLRILTMLIRAYQDETKSGEMFGKRKMP